MKPIVLCILDGVGVRKQKKGNAFLNALTPNFDYLINTYPNCLLNASGEEVGLPKNQMGNSEVGHLNIGAGRVVYQPLPYLNDKIKNKDFFNNEVIIDTINHCHKYKSSLHFLGLLSDGGIHSHIDHLLALIDLAKEQNINKLYLHLFLDGRDTLPNIGERFLKIIEKKLDEVQIGKIATVSGRFYAMDRDNRWDRTKLSYDTIVFGNGEQYNSIGDLISSNLKRNLTDEFVRPALLNKDGIIHDNDGLIVFNFRPDRLRQLFKAITNNNFNEFKIRKFKNIKVTTMFPVSEEVCSKNAFELKKLKNTLGEYLSLNDLRQLRIAETEKYAHVTYFFDGGIEKNLKNCKKILIPSPQVLTYDLKPEMSAFKITKTLLNELNDYDFIVVNYANGDMVGHTGNFSAAIEAVEAVDYCLGRLYEKVNKLKGTLIVTADHGNCEYMIDEFDNVITSHTTNKVNFIVTNKKINLNNGSLKNIAPTILELLKFEKPKEMDNSLINK